MRGRSNATHSRFAVVLIALLAAYGAAPRAEALPPLRQYDSPHYSLRTDVDAALACDLAQRLDAMYDEYTRRLIEFVPGKEMPKFSVLVFNRRADYVEFTGNRAPNTGGVFIPSRNVLAAFLEGQGRDALRRTLQHEAFHQFAYAAIGKNIPTWLNEGLAEVFEEGIYDGQRFQLGEVPPRRLRQLQEDLRSGGITDFASFLTRSEEAWERNMTDTARAASQYGQAWAMTHYLVFATDERGAPRFRARLIDMLRLIHNGKSGADAFRDAFSDNYAGFQKLFTDWANALKATELATYIEHQDVLADLLAGMDKRGRRFDSTSEFRAAMLHSGWQIEYKSGEVTWNTGPNLAVYFNDLNGVPLGGDRLFFDRLFGSTAPPDLVSRPMRGVQLRTRFYPSPSGGKLEHETLTQTPGTPPPPR
jgi:hypothetical protein